MKLIKDLLVAAYIIVPLFCVLFGFGAASIDATLENLEKRCLLPYAMNYPRCRRDD